MAEKREVFPELRSQISDLRGGAGGLGSVFGGSVFGVRGWEMEAGGDGETENGEENKKEIAVISRDENIALMVKQICQDRNGQNDNNYINVSEKSQEGNKVPQLVEHIFIGYGNKDDNRYLNVSEKKEVAVISRDEKIPDATTFNVDSNGMVNSNTSLIPSDIDNDNRYLNLSINDNVSHAEMAEWLTHFTDTEDPSGFVGSIPTLGVTDFYLEKFIETYKRFNFEEIKNTKVVK